MELKPNKKIKEFTDLLAWQVAYKLAIRIQNTLKAFPSEEKFGITSQMRRSALSVTANIAEGFGKRTYKEKVHYYYQAHGSLVETKNHLLMAKGYECISLKEFEEVMNDLDNAHKLLMGLIRSTKSLAANSRISNLDSKF